MSALKNEKQELRNHCLQIAEYLADPYQDQYNDDGCLNEEGETPTAYDYLQDVYNIEYYVDSNKEYLGARLLVAFGGPNIYVDTRYKKVEGHWWGDYAEVSFDDELGLDEACSELFNC